MLQLSEWARSSLRGPVKQTPLSKGLNSLSPFHTWTSSSGLRVLCLMQSENENQAWPWETTHHPWPARWHVACWVTTLCLGNAEGGTYCWIVERIKYSTCQVFFPGVLETFQHVSLSQSRAACKADAHCVQPRVQKNRFQQRRCGCHLLRPRVPAFSLWQLPSEHKHFLST